MSRSESSLSTSVTELGESSNANSEISCCDYDIIGKKKSVYAEVVRNLNNARERTLPFKPATSFMIAYESLGLDVSGGRSVTIHKIWSLIQSLVGEDLDIEHDVPRITALVIGARRHLESEHEKYIHDTIESHPTQAVLGGDSANLQKIRAFLRIRLKGSGVLDFDLSDARSEAPIDTTWEQIYFCLRTGYYHEARDVALSSDVSHQYAAQLSEWISTEGMVSQATAAAATEECENMLRMGAQNALTKIDKTKLLLYAIISGAQKKQISKNLSTIFCTFEDLFWFKLSAARDLWGAVSSINSDESMVPHTLGHLRGFLNKLGASRCTKNGQDPLVYPYALLLSIQMLPAIQYLSKETGEREGFNIDALHMLIALVDHGVLSDGGAGSGPELGLLDAFAEAACIICQYGLDYMVPDDLSAALEYYVQAASAMSGGASSLTGGNSDQDSQGRKMLMQLLTELLLQDGGISLLLGARDAGEEGQLRRFLSDRTAQEQFLLEAAHQCQEYGFFNKAQKLNEFLELHWGSLDGTIPPLSDDEELDEVDACDEGEVPANDISKGFLNQEWRRKDDSGKKCYLCGENSEDFTTFYAYLKHRNKAH